MRPAKLKIAAPVLTLAVHSSTSARDWNLVFVTAIVVVVTLAEAQLFGSIGQNRHHFAASGLADRTDCSTWRLQHYLLLKIL